MKNNDDYFDDYEKDIDDDTDGAYQYEDNSEDYHSDYLLNSPEREARKLCIRAVIVTLISIAIAVGGLYVWDKYFSTINVSMSLPAELLASDSDVSVCDIVSLPENATLISRPVSAADITPGQTAQVALVMKHGDTAADAYAALGLGSNKYLHYSHSGETPLVEEMELSVQLLVKVLITVDGSTTELITSAATVGEAIKESNIHLEADDRISPEPEAPTVQNMPIVIRRVTYTEETRTESISYKTVYRETSELYLNKERTVRYGEKGKKELTYKITLVDGVKESEELIDETVVLDPVNEIIEVGTRTTRAKRTTTEYYYDDDDDYDDDDE